MEGGKELMSDIVLGTIMGGAIALIATVAGYFLQGHFSVKNTRMQLEHQTKQNRENRLIEYRSTYLNPTRDCVLQCCEAVDNIEEGIVKCIARFGEKFITESRVVIISDEIETLEKFQATFEAVHNGSDNLFNRLGELQKWRRQASDLVLVRLVRDINTLYGDLIQRIRSVDDLTNEIKSGNKDRSECDLSPLLERMLDIRGALLSINYRIEQLMTGAAQEGNSEE